MMVVKLFKIRMFSNFCIGATNTVSKKLKISVEVVQALLTKNHNFVILLRESKNKIKRRKLYKTFFYKIHTLRDNSKNKFVLIFQTLPLKIFCSREPEIYRHDQNEAL